MGRHFRPGSRVLLRLIKAQGEFTVNLPTAAMLREERSNLRTVDMARGQRLLLKRLLTVHEEVDK